MSDQQPTTTIDLQAQIEQRSPALQHRVIHLPTPDQQYEVVLNTPGMTAADLAAAATWKDSENARRRSFGLDHVMAGRTRNEIASKDVAAAMHEDREHMTDWCSRAEKGDTSADVVLRAARSYRDRIAAYEREIERLEESERLLGEVESDPETYFYTFYGRYPVLAERLETLAESLYSRNAAKFRGPGSRGF